MGVNLVGVTHNGGQGCRLMVDSHVLRAGKQPASGKNGQFPWENKRPIKRPTGEIRRGMGNFKGRRSGAGREDQGKGRKPSANVRFSEIENGTPRNTVPSTDKTDVSAENRA